MPKILTRQDLLEFESNFFHTLKQKEDKSATISAITWHLGFDAELKKLSKELAEESLQDLCKRMSNDAFAKTEELLKKFNMGGL